MKEWEDFLKGYGFVPWSAGGMQGWYRQTAFVKDCLAGEIARYYADDYIVIRHEGDRSTSCRAQSYILILIHLIIKI